MKKYLSFFRLRFTMGLQYRAAALAGIATQFFWGFMEIMVFRAFYRADPAAFPLPFPAMADYIWLQQAFLALFATWIMDQDVFDTILSGNVAYELCRPLHVYDMWLARTSANRISRAVLRCFPILFVAVFLPEPYCLHAPASVFTFVLFLISLLLGLAVTVSFCMLIYVLAFFTISPQGLRIFCTSAVEFFAGAIIPLPFFPPKIQFVMELLPFAAMQNVPLRVYSGSMASHEAIRAILLQVVWLVILIAIGRLLSFVAERRTVIQGG